MKLCFHRMDWGFPHNIENYTIVYITCYANYCEHNSSIIPIDHKLRHFHIQIRNLKWKN